MPHDLTATARSNDSARRAAGADAQSVDTSGRLARFLQLVQASMFSTNVSADKVQVFGAHNEILDSRRFHIHHADGNEPAGLADFATQQGSWLVRREAFEDLWHHGRRLVYGTVNAGGMGTEGRFGPFCLVCEDPETPRPDALAVFPADTAQRYCDDIGAVDDGLARAEATSWERRGDLAVSERGDEAVTATDDAWPAVVCSPDQYLEVTRAGPMPVAALAAVRLRANYRTDLAALRLRYLAGEVLEPDEIMQAQAYDVVREWRRSEGVELVDVA